MFTVLHQWSRGTLLAKIDIRVYIALHPDDRTLLGMHWKGQLYVDTYLPFTLRYAPRIFTCRVMCQGTDVSHLFHCLDDYIIMSNTRSEECNVDTVCNRLVVPTALEKCEGPAMRLPYLGIEMDTIQIQLLMSARREIEERQATVIEWLGRKAARRRGFYCLVCNSNLPLLSYKSA